MLLFSASSLLRSLSQSSKFLHHQPLRALATQERNHKAQLRCVQAEEGGVSFASCTSHLCARGDEQSLTDHFVAKAAVKDALVTLHRTLGGHCDGVLLTTSLPRPLAALALSALKESDQFKDVPITGCSTLPWRPPHLPPARPPRHASSGSQAEPLSYVTVGGFRAPGLDVRAFYTPTSSLPHIPNLPAVLKSKINPQFLLMGIQEGTLELLKGRLENLFSSESVVAAATGTLQLPGSGGSSWGMASPSAAPGLELINFRQGSEEANSRGSTMGEVGPLIFHDSHIFSVGCSGLMMLPKNNSTDSHSSSSSNSSNSGSSRSCLPASTNTLMAQVLLGTDRSYSLALSDATLRGLQPPHTPTGVWHEVQKPAPDRNQASTASSAAQESKPKRRGGSAQPISISPIQPLPDHIKVTEGDNDEGGLDSTTGSTSHSSHSSSSSGSGSGGTESGSRKGGRERQKATTDAMDAGVVPAPRRVPASVDLPNWSLSSQVHACGGTGLPQVIQRLPNVPVFALGPNVTLFPGEEQQLRILEKRYQWLIRQAVTQQGCFVLALGHGMGVIVSVDRYLLNENNFYVVLRAGERVLFNPADMSPAAACFGLATCANVLAVQDRVQSSSEAASLPHTASQVVSLLARGTRAHMRDASAEASGVGFAGALLQLQQSSTLPKGAAAQVTGNEDGSSDSDSDSDSEEGSSLIAQQDNGSDQDLIREYEQHLEKAAAEIMDVSTASQLSLLLSSLIPVDVEKRRSFMLTFSGKRRLEEMRKHLSSFPNVAASTTGGIIASPPSHPIRQHLGIQHLPPIRD